MIIKFKYLHFKLINVVPHMNSLKKYTYPLFYHGKQHFKSKQKQISKLFPRWYKITRNKSNILKQNDYFQLAILFVRQQRLDLGSERADCDPRPGVGLVVRLDEDGEIGAGRWTGPSPQRCQSFQGRRGRWWCSQ